MTMTVKTKQRGNSVGIVIPSKVVRDLKVKPEGELDISIEKKSNVFKELFGILRTKKTTKDLIEKTRTQLESKRF